MAYPCLAAISYLHVGRLATAQPSVARMDRSYSEPAVASRQAGSLLNSARNLLSAGRLALGCLGVLVSRQAC